MIIELLVGGAAWLGAEYYKQGRGNDEKKKLDRIFRKCGLVVKYDGQEDTPKLLRSSVKENYVEYIYRIPEGLSFKKFLDKKEIIQDSLNSNKEEMSLVDLLKKKKPNTARKEVVISFDKVLSLKVYHNHLKDYYEYDKTFSEKCKGWEVPVGLTKDLELLKLDLQKHCIVAGATDMGKSNIIKLWITSLLERRPDGTILTLIDLKSGLAFNR